MKRLADGKAADLILTTGERVQSGRLYTGSNDGYCRKTGSGDPGSNAARR